MHTGDTLQSLEVLRPSRLPISETCEVSDDDASNLISHTKTFVCRSARYCVCTSAAALVSQPVFTPPLRVPHGCGVWLRPNSCGCLFATRNKRTHPPGVGVGFTQSGSRVKTRWIFVSCPSPYFFCGFRVCELVPTSPPELRPTSILTLECTASPHPPSALDQRPAPPFGTG